MIHARFSHLPGLPLILTLAISFLLVSGCNKATAPSSPKVAAGVKSSGGSHAVIETDKGPIEIEFYEKDSPKAVENFRLLAERGYYNGLTFHRIIKNFMIQGGDPVGDGTGGESAWGGTFADEIKRESELYRRNYVRGVVAMANAGPNTNGSQFFILHKDYPLPPQYVIFAHVTKGIEVVDALAQTPTKRGPDGQMSDPLTRPVMRKVTIQP